MPAKKKAPVDKMTVAELVEHLATVNPAEAKRQEVEASIVKWRERRAERLEADRVAAKLKGEEDRLKSFLLESFKQQKLEGMLIGGRTTGLASKTSPAIEDKEALVAYIKQTGDLDLLQFRLSTAAVQERWEREEEVPGVHEVETFDIFDRKA